MHIHAPVESDLYDRRRVSFYNKKRYPQKKRMPKWIEYFTCNAFLRRYNTTILFACQLALIFLVSSFVIHAPKDSVASVMQLSDCQPRCQCYYERESVPVTKRWFDFLHDTLILLVAYMVFVPILCIPVFSCVLFMYWMVIRYEMVYEELSRDECEEDFLRLFLGLRKNKKNKTP